MDAPTRASRIVAIAVLVLGPLGSIVVNGPRSLGSFVFWFGLFGWLAAAIMLGYVAYVVVAAASGRGASPN
jgi:hypothetical protein